jgi:hypothetical protein
MALCHTRVPLKVLVHSKPRRPTSRTVPAISKAELTVLLIGKAAGESRLRTSR